MSASARWGLPMMQPGQAQKEMIHNEALTLIDMIIQASVEAVGVTAPPAGPSIGTCWIVGDAPTGAWAGHAGAIAGWTEGGWRFAVPRTGFVAWCSAEAQSFRYDGEAWHVATIAGSEVTIDGHVVVRARRSAIADSAGGSVVDAEARTTIAAILAALRGHGLIAE